MQSPSSDTPPTLPSETESETLFDANDYHETSEARSARDDPPPPYEQPPHAKCLLLPTRPADWRLKHADTILLSTLAATVLVSEGLIEGSNVELLQPLPPTPTDPLSSLALSTYSTLTDILLGATAGPLEAYRQLSKTKAQAQAEADRAQDDTAYRPVADLAPPRVSEDAASSYACPTPPPGSSDGDGDSGTLHALSDVDATTATAGNPYAAVALSSGLGVARIVGAGLKAPGVYTHGLARGFHNVPRLYGDETVRREEEVEGVVGGLLAAGKGLGYGLYDGISGFFVQPVVGAQKEGALGFLKGFGKGLGGVICKPAAGACGVPGYAFTGIQKEIEKQLSRKASAAECSGVEKVLQGEDEMRGLPKEYRESIVRDWWALKLERGFD